MATTLDTNANINILEAILAQKKHGLVYFATQNLRLHQLQRTSIDLDQTLSTFAKRNGCSSFLKV